MEKISINKNGLGIFKTNTKKEAAPTNTASTNPFGIHFKGNVIQADVFETAKTSSARSNWKENIANRGRMFKSSIVGNINSFNNALKERASSIVAFGRKAKEKISGALDFANHYDVGAELKNTFGAISSRFSEARQYSVNSLSRRPVSDLESMLRDELRA